MIIYCLTNDNSARFILASPVELLTSQKNQMVHQIKADDRDGTINLYGNVKWSGATAQGQLATFRKPTTWNGWILENKALELILECKRRRFQTST